MELQDRILVTGATGVLGTAIVAELKEQGFKDVLYPSRLDLDCSCEASVDSFFKKYKPDYVFHLASLVFGIKGNQDNQLLSLIKNTEIAKNVILSASQHQVKKVFFAGTVASYAYPYSKVPLSEELFFSGEPHFGEYGYATAKRYAYCLLKILKQTKGLDFCYGVFTNIYGPNDRFNTETGHVIPSLIRKAYEADQNNKQLNVWGKPDTVRDFIYSKDAARAAIHCMQTDLTLVNISSNKPTTMGDLVLSINNCFANELTVTWDGAAPVGIPKRIVDNQRLIETGFQLQFSLQEGIQETVRWYQDNVEVIRK